MKKILLICMLFIGFSSFAARLVETEPVNTVNVQTDLIENVAVSAYDINIESIGLISCSVYVYFQGNLVTVITRDTCGEAIHDACVYVENHGGTCPYSY